jgi:hypothetical protein
MRMGKKDDFPSVRGCFGHPEECTASEKCADLTCSQIASTGAQTSSQRGKLTPFPTLRMKVKG